MNKRQQKKQWKKYMKRMSDEWNARYIPLLNIQRTPLIDSLYNKSYIVTVSDATDHVIWRLVNAQ